MKLLKIQSNSAEESIELTKILETIVNYSPNIKEYKYLISYFDGIPNNNFDGSFNNFFDAINNDIRGLIFNYDELIKKLKELFQIYDLVLLISQDIIEFEKKDLINDNFMYEKFFITVNYFDGGFWEISCQNEYLLDLLK